MENADRPLQDRLVLRGQQRDRQGSSPTPTVVSRLLHEHGALAFWDFAAAAPYVEIAMDGDLDDPAVRKDAIFLVTAQFVGGPGLPAYSCCARELMTNRVPHVPGGGTGAYAYSDRTTSPSRSGGA